MVAFVFLKIAYSDWYYQFRLTKKARMRKGAAITRLGARGPQDCGKAGASPQPLPFHFSVWSSMQATSVECAKNLPMMASGI
jgi:hypothetical protein